VESIGKLRELILWSHSRHVSYSIEDAPGEGIGVGVVDTLYREDFSANVVGRTCCLRELQGNPPDQTAEHGAWVLDIASFYAPDSSFYLYFAGKEPEAMNGDTPHIPQMAFARAVTAAIDDGVDILNVSAGKSKPNCSLGHCVYCSEVRRAERNGITVVAAAGNHPEDVVHCPGNSPTAICVGGVEMECTFNMPRSPHNPTNNPPQAYWTKVWSGQSYPESAAEGTYCSTRDCWSDGGGCETNLQVTPWDRNPNSSGDKPDVLAPIHYAGLAGDQSPFIWAASSFGAPVISGCLSGCLSMLETRVSPPGAQSAIREGADELDDFPAGVLNAEKTLEILEK